MSALLPRIALVALLLAACAAQAAPNASSVRLPDGGVYTGEIVSGLLNGSGRIEWPNGNWLKGRFKDGLAEGPGEQQFADGTYYQGTFRRGLYHGQGNLISSSGWEYHGSFVNGRMQGQGSKLDSDGTQTIGTFNDGHLNGVGQWQEPGGDRYDGEFVDDQFEGAGVYRSAGGDLWRGRFSGGELTGNGEFVGSDSSQYRGAFRNWKFDGQGVLTNSDGSVYRGNFADGVYAGMGVLTRADGQVERGLWEGGKRIRDDQGQYIADPLERALLDQGKVLDQELQQIPASTPATELYGLVLAGDGGQGVFQREANYVANFLTTTWGARDVVHLINAKDIRSDHPLATRENLYQSLQALAQRTGPEDLILIYLTSHGSADHQLVLSQPGLDLSSLPAAELGRLLAPLRGRDKLIIVSSCYSGGFIPQLQDDHTLVMTASKADRTSFGCTDEADFTYFGRALFAEAFQHTDDPEQAFQRARDTVSVREKPEGFGPSEPQLGAPPAVLQKWRAWRASR